MGLYKKGTKTRGCCINPKTSNSHYLQSRAWIRSHLLTVLVHTLFILHLLTPQISQSSSTGVWELLLLFSSSLYSTHNVGSEGLVFFHLLKHKSLSTGDNAACAQ